MSLPDHPDAGWTRKPNCEGLHEALYTLKHAADNLTRVFGASVYADMAREPASVIVAPPSGREAAARTFVAVAAPAHRHATCGEPCWCGPAVEDYREGAARGQG